MDIENVDNQKYAFMLDVSGSVGGSQNYWNTINQLLAIHGQAIDHFYFWDTMIEIVNKKKYEEAILKRMGRGGTSPQLVARQIVDKKLKKVILVTDGQVSDRSVQECDRLLQNHTFTKTICYIISTSGYGGGNMSVTCPFTRKCENQIYEKPYSGPMKKLAQFTPDDYKILDTLDEITLENFATSYEKIQGLIIALNMGKEGNIPLKNQLVVMKNRLVKQLSKKSAKKDINEVIRTHLEKGQLEEAIQYSRELTKKYLEDNITLELEKQISHLISLCGDLRGKYDLNQIKSNKMDHAIEAKEGQLDQEVQMAELSQNPIQCPIILDEDVPQILIDDCQPLLVGIEKAIVDDITTCPLRLLNYPDIKAKLKSRLSNFMGVKYADKFFKNPFTQNKLLGAIPLGCHKSHIKVGNHTIAKMMSDGKILGNLNLFYAVIWHIIKEKEIEYLKDIEKNATQHLLYRLKNTKTMASLSGLSQLVSTQINTDLAVWYCANSCCMNQPLERDTFRFHTYSMGPIIDIVQALGYPYHKGVETYLRRIKALLSTLSAFKKLPVEKRANFLQALSCLHQNSVEINNKNIRKEVLKKQTFVNFVPIDGEASKDQVKRILSFMPDDLKNLSLEEIVEIGKLIDTQKLASEIPLAFDSQIKPLEKGKVCWQYGAKVFEKEQINICPKTFRSTFSLKGEKWETFAEKTYKMSVDKLFKARKYFEAFLMKYKLMPTKDELILFYYNRIVVKGNKETLPFQVVSWASQILEQYNTVMTSHNITIEEGVSRLAKSFPRETRNELKKE